MWLRAVLQFLGLIVHGCYQFVPLYMLWAKHLPYLTFYT